METEQAIQWTENVELCAQRLSRKMEEAFVFELKAASTFLPHKHLPTSEAMMGKECVDLYEIMLDYLLGTTVALTCGASKEIGLAFDATSQQFEDNIVAQIRDKFNRLREREKSAQ